MDTKDINISKSEEEALKIMGDTSSVTSGQIQSLKEDEECMQICSDMAELAIEMRKAKNTLAMIHRKSWLIFIVNILKIISTEKILLSFG